MIKTAEELQLARHAGQVAGAMMAAISLLLIHLKKRGALGRPGDKQRRLA